jgi:MFS family permease
MSARPSIMTAAPPPGLSVASIIVSMGLIGLANGLMFAWIPVRLVDAGFAPWVAGTLVTAVAAGGIVGCLIAGAVVRRVGHARAFAVYAALEVLTKVMVGWDPEPILWIVSRFIYGFAINGLFVVSQSWLNDAAENRWRGRVISIFYMVYILSLGGGGFLLRYMPLEGSTAALASTALVALGILPVALTRLPAPPPPEQVRVALGRVWRISPVGLMGMLVIGGVSMLVQGFAPIYAATEGMAKEDIGTLLFAMQFGMILVQVPFGALSDRIDRRIVLVAACAVVIVAAASATQVPVTALIPLILVFAVWSGAVESVYSISTAHTNDRADPREFVSVSSTLLVAWSISAFVLPLIATALTPLLGPRAFMLVVIGAAMVYGAFVLWRMIQREPAPEEEQVSFQPLSAQAPLTPELAPLPPEEEAPR